jgi:predicted phage terminase large subunit-like protein
MAKSLRIEEVAAYASKSIRAEAVSAAWNEGRVRTPIHDAPWLGDFEHEVEKFTGVSDAHDDQVDAMAHAWNYLATRETGRVQGGGHLSL